jgi:hypothetical protein
MPAKKTTKTTVTKTVATKKSAPRKAPVKKAPAKVKRATAKPVVIPIPQLAPTVARASAASRRVVTPEQRFRMIEEQAYFIAERDGFNGHPDAYWFAAEREVESMLGE